MVKAGMQAVTINSEGLAYQQREFIANLAIARRLPLSVWSSIANRARRLKRTARGALLSSGELTPPVGVDWPARFALWVRQASRAGISWRVPLAVEFAESLEPLTNSIFVSNPRIVRPHALVFDVTESG